MDKPMFEIKFCVITEIPKYDPEDECVYGVYDADIQLQDGIVYVGCYEHDLPGDLLATVKVPSFSLGDVIIVETSGSGPTKTLPMEVFNKRKPGRHEVGHKIFDDLPSALRCAWEVLGMDDAEDFYDMTEFLARYGTKPAFVTSSDPSKPGEYDAKADRE